MDTHAHGHNALLADGAWRLPPCCLGSSLALEVRYSPSLASFPLGVCTFGSLCASRLRLERPRRRWRTNRAEQGRLRGRSPARACTHITPTPHTRPRPPTPSCPPTPAFYTAGLPTSLRLCPNFSHIQTPGHAMSWTGDCPLPSPWEGHTQRPCACRSILAVASGCC